MMMSSCRYAANANPLCLKRGENALIAYVLKNFAKYFFKVEERKAMVLAGAHFSRPA
jgi:hypothetical protein